LSPSSSDSQATLSWVVATQALSRVVLPKPAGAETRVSLRCRPSSSRSTKRGRSTAFGGSGGIKILVARIWVGCTVRAVIASAASYRRGNRHAIGRDRTAIGWERRLHTPHQQRD